MKKIMRMMLSAILCITMMCTLLVGCGSNNASETKSKEDTAKDTTGGESKETKSGETVAGSSSELEPVTLHFIFYGDKKAATDEIWDAIAEYTKDTLNASFDIQFVAGDDYKNKLMVKAATGDAWDMNFDSDWTSYYLMVEKGAYLALDDLLPVYAPDLYEVYEKAGVLDAARYNGEIMSIPWTMTMNNRSFFQWRGDLAKAAGIEIDKDKLTTYEDIDNLLTQLKAAYPDRYIAEAAEFLPVEENWLELSHSYLVDLTDPNYKVVSKEETEAYLKASTYAKKWQDEGIIWKDVLTDKQDHNALINQGKLLTKFGTHEYATQERAWAEEGAYWDYAELYPDNYFANRSPLSNAMCISATSENPERTLMFLNMLETDQKLYDMVHYGILGKTYELDGEEAVYPEGMTSENSSFMEWGGRWALWKPQFIRPDSTYSEGFWEREAEFVASKEQNVVSPLEGFNFDATSVKTEVAQRDQIFNDAHELLKVGLAGDPVEVLEKLKSDLKSAGSDAIQEEFQRQVDEFIANKK